MLAPLRLYRQSGADRVAIVSTAPASQPGWWMVVVARGSRPQKLGQGMVFGPYPEDALQPRFDDAVAQLLAEGFQRSGVGLLVGQLSSASPRQRARAALRLGWMRSKDAVDPLVAQLPSSVDDVCSLIDALGEIGDPKAIAAVVPYAERKLLSRRRSGVEALRKLGAADYLEAARQRALDRLPDPVRTVVLAANEKDKTHAVAISKAVLAVPAKEQGQTLDVLYEMGTPACVRAVRLLAKDRKLGAPGTWRYAKSVLKRSLLRHDFRMFGWLAHRIEVEARTHLGTTATVKSGYDGKEHQTPIFRRRTQKFVQRLTWRYLRKLARWRPDQYPFAAAEALVPYSLADAQKPKRLYGEWASAYLLHRVLFGKSTRFTHDARTMKFRFKSAKLTDAPPNVREEAFPELWDAHPEAYLRLLTSARLPEVHRFALAGIKRAPHAVIEQATMEQLRRMLEAPYEPTVELGLSELSHRFDPSQPDWALLERLVKDERPVARELGLRWLKLTAHLWSRDLERAWALLGLPPGDAQAAVSELLVPALAGAPEKLRQALAERVLQAFAVKEEPEGAHERYLRIARDALLPELGRALSLEQVLGWISEGSLAMQAVGGALLASRPEALDKLGLDGLHALADHEVLAVRAAAAGLIRSALPRLREDPKLLFALAESRWPDVRAQAVSMLAEVDLSRFGLEGLLALCDSGHREVQELGKARVLEQLPSLDPHELLFRLSQHPDKNLRRFALDLVETHLKAGFVPLAKLELFFRTALLEYWPDRAMKRRALALLAERGVKDEHQAELAAGILKDILRTAVKGDFELAAQALVRIKLAFPAVDTELAVRAPDEKGAPS